MSQDADLREIERQMLEAQNRLKTAIARWNGRRWQEFSATPAKTDVDANAGERMSVLQLLMRS